MKPNVPRLVTAVIASLYFLSIAYDPMADGLWNFLSLVDLPIHEAGHLIFRLFGEFMMIAGGSIFQVIVPAAFFGYFVQRRQFFSGAMVLFWVGQSILNVWVYADDAVRMKLVLLTGLTGSEGSFHDWNYLFTSTGLMNYHGLISGLIRFSGTIVILAAAAGTIYFSFKEETNTRNDL